MQFKNIKTLDAHYKHPMSYRIGTIYDKNGIVRVYSNGNNSDYEKNTFFYYNGKQAVTDILKFKLIKSKKNLKIYEELIKLFETKSKPIMPINADMLMTKYKVPEGKELGDKLKLIENEWVNNNFQISDTKLENIINN